MILLIWIVLSLLRPFRGQELGTITILQIDDEANAKARQAVAAALNCFNNSTDLGLTANLEYYGGRVNITSYVHLNEMCHLYDQMVANDLPPDLVIDTSRYHPVTKAARLISRKLMLPELILSVGHKPRNSTLAERELLLKVQPPANTIPILVDHLMTKLSMTSVVIFYEPNEFSMNGLLRKWRAGNATRSYIIRKLEPKNKRLRELELKQLRNEKEMKNFFVLGSPENITAFLESVDRQFFHSTFSWTAISTMDQELVVHLWNATILYARPVVGDLQAMAEVKRCMDAEGDVDVSATFYFEMAQKSLLAVRDAKLVGSWNITAIKCTDFEGDAPVNLVDLKNHYKEVVNQSQVYGPVVYGEVEKSIDTVEGHLEVTMSLESVVVEDGKTKKITTLGAWQTGFNNEIKVLDDDKLMAMKPANLLRVVGVQKPPFLMQDPSAPHGYKGICIDLMDRIAARINISYEIHVVNEVGKLNEQGEWSGIVRELRAKNYDVGLGAISVMSERQNDVDFTVPFYDLVGIHIMMLAPTPPSSMAKFLEVLEPDVWYAQLFTYFMASCLMWLFARFSPYSYQNNRDKFVDALIKREFSLRECFWFCMMSLTPQGGGDAPRNLSGRLVAATWWLYGFIIMASYTANLAAHLTLPQIDHTLETLDDFSQQYKIRYAPINGSPAMDYFERMALIEKRFYHIWERKALNISLTATERARLAVWEFPVGDKFTKLWKAMQETGLFTSLAQALEKVRSSTTSSGYAFIGDSDDIRYQVMTNCDLITVGEVFSKKPYAIALQRGSPLKEAFDEAILDLLSKREIETIKNKWWVPPPDHKCPAREDPNDGISMSNIGGVFMVILAGLAVSLVTLTFEYFHYRGKASAESVGGSVFDWDRKTGDDLALADEHMSTNSIYSNFPMLRRRARSQSLSYDFKP